MGGEGSQPRLGEASAQWMPRVKPEAPRREPSPLPAPDETQPHPAAGRLWGQLLSRENLAAALRRVEQNAGAPGTTTSSSVPPAPVNTAAQWRTFQFLEVVQY